MADISITNSTVLPASTAKLDKSGTAGAVVAAGDWVYKSSGTWLKADADASTTDSTKSVAVGMVATDGLIIGSPIVVVTEGDVDVGSVVAQGVPYVLSGGAGKMCPVADLATNDWVTYLCTGVDANTIRIKINPTLIKFG